MNSHQKFCLDSNEERENHVLLITVLNPAYPITCVSYHTIHPFVIVTLLLQDVIHQICSPQGKVMRVVIFKKNGVQAMVEFDSVDSARRAKLNLHGCDIYSGCCTLRIEYAKVIIDSFKYSQQLISFLQPTRLNVYKNDSESYDFTNPTLGAFGKNFRPYIALP